MGDRLKRCYIVNAYIRAVTHLRVKAEEWHLECDIADDYSQKLLSVKFHTDIVEHLTATPFQEIMEMYKQMKSDPHVKQIIARVSINYMTALSELISNFALQIIEDLQEKLKNLKCFMKIKMELQINCQVSSQIIELLEKKECDNLTFLKKLKEENVLG